MFGGEFKCAIQRSVIREIKLLDRVRRTGSSGSGSQQQNCRHETSRSVGASGGPHERGFAYEIRAQKRGVLVVGRARVLLYVFLCFVRLLARIKSQTTPTPKPIREKGHEDGASRSKTIGHHRVRGQHPSRESKNVTSENDNNNNNREAT